MKEPEISASRGPPKKCKPLVHKGIEYNAPWGKMGYIEARDKKSKKFLWALKVYNVENIQDLERDVQERYIISLELKKGHLEVVNEGNERFSINLKTKEITKL